MSKSLGRLDAVRNAKASLKTQSATVTFIPGQPIDFRALAGAVDKAGFSAGKITIWSTGTLEMQDGRPAFTISGSNQRLPIADSPRLAELKDKAGTEASIVAEVEFEKDPPRLMLVEPGRASTDGMKGMKGMKK